MSAATNSIIIDGRRVEFPVEVRDASSGSAVYAVPSAAARALLPDDAFDLVEVWPGRALCVLAIIDYKDNDLGDYNEVSVALFVRPAGERPRLPWIGNWIDLVAGRLGVHILHLPVDQPFTCEAGRQIWGFPKTVEQIDFSYKPGRATCQLIMGGQHTLTLSLPRGGTGSLSGQEMKTWTYIDGQPHLTRAAQGADGVGMSLGGAELELGEGPVADQLRSLGLPRRPLFCAWMERFHASFALPEAVDRIGAGDAASAPPLPASSSGA